MAKIALVTGTVRSKQLYLADYHSGASSGIGKSCSIALGKAGWTVVVTARRRDALEETAREIASAYIVAGDLVSSSLSPYVWNLTV